MHSLEYVTKKSIKNWQLIGYTQLGGWKDDWDQKRCHMRQDESARKQQSSGLKKEFSKNNMEAFSEAKGKKDSSSEEEENQKEKLQWKRGS